jgi:hypothetical protein
MNSIENFLQKNNKTLYQCIDDLSLNYLYKDENITFLLPDDTNVINNIIYNYINNQETAINQIRSLFIKGYFPKLEHFDRVEIINCNNEKLNFNKEKSNNESVILGNDYQVYINPNYVKRSGYMLYNLKVNKLPLKGLTVEKEKQTVKYKTKNSNINLNNIKNKLHTFIKNNYYNFLKKDMNIFIILSNLILNGLLKNTISENKVINSESQKILDTVNNKLSPISRATVYLLLDNDDTFNIFKHINNDIYEFIENILLNRININVLNKCNSIVTYTKLLNHIKSNTTNSYKIPIIEKVQKLKSMANNPTNIEFINYLKKVYKETYLEDYKNVLNNHIFTVICEIYICIENAESNQMGIKSGYNEFKDKFIIFIETSKLNELIKYSNDVVRMHSIFNTLTKCNIFLHDSNKDYITLKNKSNTNVYNRIPTDADTIFIYENEDMEDNENYDKLLDI